MTHKPFTDSKYLCDHIRLTETRVCSLFLSAHLDHNELLSSILFGDLLLEHHEVFSCSFGASALCVLFWNINRESGMADEANRGDRPQRQHGDAQLFCGRP